MLSLLARSHRDNIGLLVGYNEPMARRIVANAAETSSPDEAGEQEV